jgi:hypothetical protein
MSIVAHEFSLYRSGWSGDEVPWSDNQLWASVPHAELSPEAAENCFDLYPQYGSAASWYRIRLTPGESPETGWTSWRVQLAIDYCNMSQIWLPLSWYDAEPSDWPSGLVRFREPDGFHPASFPWPTPGARGVWTLAARRSR